MNLKIQINLILFFTKIVVIVNLNSSRNSEIGPNKQIRGQRISNKQRAEVLEANNHLKASYCRKKRKKARNIKQSNKKNNANANKNNKTTSTCITKLKQKLKSKYNALLINTNKANKHKTPYFFTNLYHFFYRNWLLFETKYRIFLEMNDKPKDNIIFGKDSQFLDKQSLEKHIKSEKIEDYKQRKTEETKAKPIVHIDISDENQVKKAKAGKVVVRKKSAKQTEKKTTTSEKEGGKVEQIQPVYSVKAKSSNKRLLDRSSDESFKESDSPEQAKQGKSAKKHQTRSNWAKEEDESSTEKEIEENENIQNISEYSINAQACNGHLSEKHDELQNKKGAYEAVQINKTNKIKMSENATHDNVLDDGMDSNPGTSENVFSSHSAEKPQTNTNTASSLVQKDKILGPIKICLSNKEDHKEQWAQDQISGLKAKYTRISYDNWGNLLIFPCTEHDCQEIMNSSTFFGDKFKINLGKERCSLIFNNITLAEVENDVDLRKELERFGIIECTSVMRNQPPSTKLVKAYCKDEDTMRKLLENHISIKTEHLNIVITTMVNVRPTVQCNKCLDYRHRERDCTGDVVCAKCSEGHNEKECESDLTKCINCGESHNAKERRACSYYKKCRKYDVNEANAKMKNKTPNKESEVKGDKSKESETFTRVFSLQKDLEGINNRIEQVLTENKSAIKGNEASNQKMNDKMDLLLASLTAVIEKKCNEVYTKVSNETDKKITSSEQKIMEFVCKNFAPISNNKNQTEVAASKSNSNNENRNGNNGSRSSLPRSY